MVTVNLCSRPEVASSGVAGNPENASPPSEGDSGEVPIVVVNDPVAGVREVSQHPEKLQWYFMDNVEDRGKTNEFLDFSSPIN